LRPYDVGKHEPDHRRPNLVNLVNPVNPVNP
jgi:hypothetical protein